MHNNHFFLKRLAEEIESKIIGLPLLETFTQTKNELVLGFADSSSEFYLKADFQSWMSCLWFGDSFARAKRNTREINVFQDRVVAACRVIEGERVIEILFEDSSDRILLICFGNRSNVVFEQEGEIVFRLKPKLALPDLSPKFMTASISSDLNITELAAQLPQLGNETLQFVQTQFGEKITPEQFEDLSNLLQFGSIYTTKIDDESSLSLVPVGEIDQQFDSPIEALNTFYRSYVVAELFKKEKDEAKREIQRQLKATRKYLKSTEAKLDRLLNRDSLKQVADVIMANLHAIPKGSEKATLLNFYINEDVEITFKNRIAPQDLAAKYYRKAKNEEKELNTLEANIQNAVAKTQVLEGRLSSLDSIESLKELRKQFDTNTKSVNKKKNEEVASEFKEVMVQGYKVLIGRNAKNNDVLTLKEAKKNDLWLHAKDVSGSHVVIKHQAGRNVPKQVIEVAAQLAAYYSKRKTDSLVPVTVTEKKYVRKVKGAAPGSVVVEKESIVLVPPVNERLLP